MFMQIITNSVGRYSHICLCVCLKMYHLCTLDPKLWITTHLCDCGIARIHVHLRIARIHVHLRIARIHVHLRIARIHVHQRILR